MLNNIYNRGILCCDVTYIRELEEQYLLARTLLDTYVTTTVRTLVKVYNNGIKLIVLFMCVIYRPEKWCDVTYIREYDFFQLSIHFL